jgi:hypothetical protein
MEGGGDQLHHGLLLEAVGGGVGVALGVERPAVVARPGETPAISGLVDVRLFGAGPYHLLRRFQCLTHFLRVPFLTAMSGVYADRLFRAAAVPRSTRLRAGYWKIKFGDWALQKLSGYLHFTKDKVIFAKWLDHSGTGRCKGRI